MVVTTFLASLTGALTAFAVAAANLEAAPALPAAYGPNRIRALQYKASHLRHPESRKRRRGVAGPSATPHKYCGTNPGYNPNQQCSSGGGSDGCTDPVYSVSASGITLNGGTFPDNGHVNYCYVPYAQYGGLGDWNNREAGWNVQCNGVHFESQNNQPSGKYIGASSLSWSEIGAPADTGYCVLWVQYSDANQHYGEGGQGAACYCPGVGSSSGGGGGGAATPTSTSSSAITTSTSPSSSSSSSTSTSSAPPQKTVGIYDQCYDASWTHPAYACTQGTECVPSSPGSTYYQCRSTRCGVGNLERLDQSCGGIGFTGETCCPEGQYCARFDAYNSRCQIGSPPSMTSTSAAPTGTVGAWQQCGGGAYSGPTTCTSGYHCEGNEYYKQCIPN